MFLQEDGGPIGDELAQAVARLVMIWWDNKFLELCTRVGVDVLFFTRYVDDTNKAVIPPPLGTRFEEGSLVIKPELVQEDGNLDRDKVTGELFRSLANSISPMLQFEEDVCSNYADGKLPILDLKVWKEYAEESGVVTIKHEFYKKPMASRATLRANTAYPTSKIRSVMVEEVLRRLRNCSPECTWEERGKYLTEFAVALKSSGHSEHFRQVVFEKAVARFEKELANHHDGTADLYRTREERERQIVLKGGKADKDSWFRQKEGDSDQRVTSILSVPYTSKSSLTSEVKRIFDKTQLPTGLKSKAQESSGSKLQHCLVRPDPFPRERCQRAGCPVNGEEGCLDKCFQGHVNYLITCVRCEKSRKDATEAAKQQGD